MTSLEENSMSFNHYESYDNFLGRIFSFEKPDFSFGVAKFNPSGSVSKKVNEDGTFRRFIGDTVVFDLEHSQKQLIKTFYIDPLYDVAGGCFAEKFHETTIHMTLHDLNSSEYDDYDVLKKMFETEVELVKRIRDVACAPDSIKMVTTCVFNMVNTSMVIGLVPKTQEDYHKLMKLYNVVDDICQLPYPLTPHITLAYYNRNGFEGELLTEIERIVNKMNDVSHEIVLSTSRLYYQKFVNMNTFFNVIPFIK